jgi:2,4-dienoyl-CoA reductase-like NADH-dependent reductase (Old Yellow Enzyme family)/thioredoxin reductase
MKHSLLREPFRLKNIELRNRIVMAPMLSRLSLPNGIVSQKLIDYYAERAKGGAGMIIVEYSYIDNLESKAHPLQLGVYDDQLIGGLADLAEVIQERGAKAILQICHAGRSSSAGYMGLQPIAPSAMPGLEGKIAREMTLEELERIIESFAEAARRAKTAGFDGVELHGTHGYLMAQFVSPYTNRRTDVYGKDRGLFSLKTLERVRSKVGNDYLVGYRMTGDEFMAGAVTLEETKPLAKRLEEKGIDYIHVSGGFLENGEHSLIPLYFAPGHLLHLAAGIKSVVHVPVIAVGAVHNPDLAEETLQKKQADLIAMGRALIADPELPNKIQAGRLEDIRTCLRCNDGCVSRTPLNRSQHCSINAEVGREREMQILPTLKAKKVCVIGGGPAGLEAARVLALRKHRVTLIEKEKELGGLLRFASIPAFKVELKTYLAYLKTQVEKLGVEIQLSQEGNVELLKKLQPDTVILATGSTFRLPDISGIRNSFVANASDLLSEKFQAKKKVLVAGGAAMGCEVAAHLASSGRKVTLVEMLGELCPDMEPRTRKTLLDMLKDSGVEVFTDWKVEKIDTGGVTLMNRNWERREVPADSVVLALGLKSNQELLKPLKANFSEVYAIGDCVEPRKIYQAVHEAAFIGRMI